MISHYPGLVVLSPDHASQTQQQQLQEKEEERDRESTYRVPPELPFGPQIIQVVKFSAEITLIIYI